jgi:hypothetical protein
MSENLWSYIRGGTYLSRQPLILRSVCTLCGRSLSSRREVGQLHKVLHRDQLILVNRYILGGTNCGKPSIEAW